MNETKEKILTISLELFSQKGYSAVSIREICKLVEIKESSVYYHFKNKQAIFDEILCRFQKKANSMMEQFASMLFTNQEKPGDDFYTVICNHFFENYLMDDFCNQVMRLMSIEQFNNEEVKKAYDYWILTEPVRFQTDIFQMLVDKERLPKADSAYIAIQYYAPIFFFAQKWLFSGKLSEERKNAFRQESYKHIQVFFSKAGGLNG